VLVPGTTTNPGLCGEICGGGGETPLEHVCLLTLYFSHVSMISPQLHTRYKATLQKDERGKTVNLKENYGLLSVGEQGIEFFFFYEPNACNFRSTCREQVSPKRYCRLPKCV